MLWCSRCSCYSVELTEYDSSSNKMNVPKPDNIIIVQDTINFRQCYIQAVTAVNFEFGARQRLSAT